MLSIVLLLFFRQSGGGNFFFTAGGPGKSEQQRPQGVNILRNILRPGGLMLRPVPVAKEDPDGGEAISWAPRCRSGGRPP